jgi:hypothetical protein
MIKAIEFRGKCIDAHIRADEALIAPLGEWVYGSLLITNTSQLSKNEVTQIYQISDEYGVAVQVDPLSVGQYIGCLDRKIKKIFEDDIILVANNGEDNVGRVYYNSAHCAYMIEFKNGGYAKLESFTSAFIEVIGNLYNQPELWK